MPVWWFLAAAALWPLLSATFNLPDTAGVRHTSAEVRRSKAAVFAFIATDCPISKAYAPELARLHAEYAPRGVAFLAVHSDPAVSAPEVRRHVREFGYPFPTLLDPKQTLARALGVKVTLEVAVVSPEGRLLYRGRVDDRYVDFGKTRPAAHRQDLRAALEQILAGKPVTEPETRALGCAIPFELTPRPAEVTFTRDIAPILFRNCAGCHRPGEVAPFPLLTYQDAARRASLITRVTASRYMPPWLPAAGYGHFQGERRLTEAEIQRIRRWAEAGAPEGNPRDLPPPPEFPQGWRMGKPDLVLRMPKPFAVSADGPDRYECFVVPMGLNADRYVQAAEFRAGDRTLVHHALFLLDRSGLARRRGEQYPCFGTPGFLPSGALGGWTPGSSPIHMPAGISIPVRRGTDLVFQIHYHPIGKPGLDQSELALYFTAQPPQKHVVDIALVSRAIDIPAGDASYKVRDHFTTPVDVEAIGIIPHAHYICKDMKGWAVLPDGRKVWLIWIRDWDFNWQDQYHYAAPIRFPAGTRFEMEFTYDNSTANVRNPNHPPKRVRWGPDSTDEMAGLHIQVVPVHNADLPELGQALWGKIMRSVGGGFYRRPEAYSDKRF
ncbi:MAG TPA: thioredoxin family protein [Bryobacteraceae bacterium]|nr:thioredoxin family protein [Bryobacteraceae bacterium]